MAKSAAGAEGTFPFSEPISEYEREYLEHRAEVEIASAQASEHPAAVRSHYLLAGYYLDRLYGQDNDAQDAGRQSWIGRGRC